MSEPYAVIGAFAIISVAGIAIYEFVMFVRRKHGR